MSQVTPNTGAMLQEAEDLVGTPYVWGGGHDGWDTVATLRRLGVDCSGFVSAVLHAGGYLSQPVTTQTLPGAPGISSGAGKDVTIWDSTTGDEHTFIDIGGTFFQAPHTGQTVQTMDASTVHALLSEGTFKPYHPSGDPSTTISGSGGGGGGTSLGSIGTSALNFVDPGAGTAVSDTAQATEMFVNFAEHPERALLTVALVAAGALLSFTGIRRMIGSQEASS